MSIEVPVPRPESLTRPEGDAALADELAEELYRVAGRYEEYAEETVAIGVRDWQGEAFRAHLAAAGRASRDHAAMAATVERVGRAVTAYADRLRVHTHTFAVLQDTRRVLDSRRADLVGDVAAAVEPDPAQLADLGERAEELRRDYAALVAEHDHLLARVRDDEVQLRSAFVHATRRDDATSEEGGVSGVAATAMGLPGAPGARSTPAQVARWWAGLSRAQRAAVVASHPEVIGAADGLPARARDRANRVLLDDDRATLGAKEADGTLDPDDAVVLDHVRDIDTALTQADGLTDPLSGEHPGGTLWVYAPEDFGGDGRVAIAVGDVDTASDVAVLTPGITTDASDACRGVVQVSSLYDTTRYAGDGSSVATVLWIGYDAPDGVTDPATYTEERARDGGVRLADAIEGLRASRGDRDPANLTVIGHSYGSTTTAYAVVEGRADVDGVVLIGSPGAGPAQDAGDLHDHVYVGRDSRDLVATLGDEGRVGKGPVGLGVDPSSEDFGATRFRAEREDRGDVLGVGEAHSAYLDPDSESLANLGRIVDGHGDEVTVAAHTRDPWFGRPVDPEWEREPEVERAPGADPSYVMRKGTNRCGSP